MKKKMVGILLVFCAAAALFAIWMKIKLQHDAALAGVIGAADGPTAIFVTYPEADTHFFAFGAVVLLLAVIFCLLYYRRNY